MTVFGAYARYYDLLYRDKDYASEAEFVWKLIHGRASRIDSILELGCGTGAHARHFATKGCDVVGIDSSESMLQRAVDRRETLPASEAERLHFDHGDIRTYRSGKNFDAAISLFHVFSYQTDNAALTAAIETAAIHLAPGAPLLFDFWYGPAVLTDRPSVRVKRMADEFVDVLRIAEPIMHANRNVVDVHYTGWITEKTTGRIEPFQEVHPMRYFFLPEVDALLNANGFEMDLACEWMTGAELGFGTWSGTICAIRK